jgi:demethylsterigmatocystin 6-O-methyltransferase
MRGADVTAARFYYMRGVLHDFPDHKSREILRNTAAAMGPESVLLLDEMVLPDQGVHWMAASMDLQMLAWLASQERTRTQWEELLKSAGMEIVDVYAHRPSAYESLIVVRVANE